MENNLVLKINNLKTYFYLDEGTLKAVDGVSLKVKKKGTLGIIGESGCGKSVTAQSVLGIVPHPGKTIEGEVILYQDNKKALDLSGLDPRGKKIRSIRGKEIAMIFQEPMTSFSPLHTIGNQIMEAILLHVTKDKNEAKELAVKALREVGIPNPDQRMNAYPHQLSGGLRQRAMIAMALSCAPSLLIADEPTTALDVTVQAQILELMKRLQDQFGMAIMYITHNLGVIAEIANEVAVMYLGKIVEYAKVDEIFHNPLHPYTVKLLRSIPKAGKKAKTSLETIEGQVPLPLNLPQECGFYPRCSKIKKELCSKGIPPLVEVNAGHWARCFLYEK